MVGVNPLTGLAGGGHHSLALMSDGTVTAWGFNDDGQLGDATTTSSSKPVQVSRLTGVVAVAAGGFHSLAVKSDGTVWSWGQGGDGQLGNGLITSSSTPVQIGITGVVAVAAGGRHSHALKSDGTVWSWGYGEDGQLGNATKVSRTLPVQVSGLTGAVAIAAGNRHSLATKSDGTVAAWGLGSDGQLGNGATASSSTAVPVSGLSGAVSVSAGDHHSLATRSDGTVRAWGRGSDGELGNGAMASSSTPVQVSGLTGAAGVAGGANHSLARKSDGTVWAWGRNSHGQLGDGTTAARVVPVRASSLTGVVGVAAGGYHSLAISGAVWGFGNNQYGNLGDGSTTSRSTPVRVATSSTSAYTYNGDGLRASKTANGVTSRFAWDLSGPLPQVLHDGHRSYLYGPGGIAVAHIADATAVSLVGSSSVSDAGTGRRLVVPVPAGTAGGDQILIATTHQGDAVVDAPPGYTLVGSYVSSTAARQAKTGLFRRTATGDETTAEFSYTVTSAKAAVAVTYRGADAADTIDAISFAGAPVTSVVTAPSLTATRAGARLVMFQGATDNVSLATWSPPAGMAQLAQNSQPLVAVGVADQALPNPGPTGSRTATLSTTARLVGVMVALRPPPDTAYYHHDQLGSTRLLTDKDGAVVANFTYDAYGKAVSATGTFTPLGFAGQYTDAETGFQYLRARYYDPATAQFLTRDPLEAETREPYGYVGGDPLNKIDPSGMHPCGAVEQIGRRMSVNRSSRHCGLSPEQERQFLERERKAAEKAECDRREAEAAARAQAARSRMIPHWPGLFRGVIEDEFFRAQAARAANMFYTTGKTTVQHIRDAGPAICQITNGRFCWQ